MLLLIIVLVCMALGGVGYWYKCRTVPPVPPTAPTPPVVTGPIAVDHSPHFWRDAKTGKRLTAREAAKRDPATVVRESTKKK